MKTENEITHATDILMFVCLFYVQVKEGNNSVLPQYDNSTKF